MAYEGVMDAVIDALLFLEFRGPTVVNEDDAVEMMETIASDLRRLSATEREQFVDYLDRRAIGMPEGRERAFVRSLASTFGIG